MSSAPTTTTFYCHGLPGSPDETSKFIRANPPEFHFLKPLDFDGFDKIVLESKASKTHIIGFSLGAMTALKIAALRPNHVSKISLIAPAAPLDMGDFISKMAGQPVFNMASNGTIPFAIFTAIQKLGVSIIPKKIIRIMFADSPQADIALLSDIDFERSLLNGLMSSFGNESQLYRRAVLEYVQPWAHQLATIKCPITIHHGALDTWTPVEMAHALEKEIKSDIEVITYEELGHYSTLHKALPIVLESCRSE